ncbi:MAG: 16S rRNA (cytosine(1402)-N(4))-methyltransferase [Flavobacteriales bacterium CG03_land_8_20_14_0_80_35_15]|nr:MAG: 16S rRNA (cytosine(1402)-N(4))-methyltransferase [Flavobacteriaceae bacterium CG1_02_35_72]PIV16066.1 MAG: 16S rRNA (cytosine(1402)-N(4))-methyltransferase [Flavobacteriales bacterium CG03_land_8_20_14_0_80_35_15]
MDYHDPVLLQASIAGLEIIPDGIYVDVTFGGGGHSKELLKRLNKNGRLFAFDQDEDAKKNNLLDDRFVLIQGNFKFIKRFLRVYGVTKVNGILADLGVSSHQFDVPERGFSTRFDALLDMRMDSKSELSAYEVVNTYTEAKLKAILLEYGELNNAKAIAQAIVKARQETPIKTSFQLKEAISKFLPPIKQHKILAQLFQAIRIEVNQELEVLKAFLLQTTDLLVSDGKMSIISYHSLEDRLVKNFFKYGNFEGEPEKDFYGNINTPFKKPKKLIVPSNDEIKNNNRARSAKLRIVTKI